MSKKGIINLLIKIKYTGDLSAPDHFIEAILSDTHVLITDTCNSVLTLQINPMFLLSIALQASFIMLIIVKKLIEMSVIRSRSLRTIGSLSCTVG